MEVALVRLVGTAVAALARPAVEPQAVAEPFEDGLALVARLLKSGCAWPRPLIETATAAILAEWRSAALPARLAAAALDHLPDVLVRHAPPPARTRAIIAEACAAQRQGYGAEAIADRLVNEILAAADAAGTLRKLRLNRALCGVLLEPLLRSVLSAAGDIAALAGPFDAGDAPSNISSAVSTEPASTNVVPMPMPTPERALPRTLTPQLASRVRSSLAARGKDEAFIERCHTDIEVRATQMFAAFAALCADPAAASVRDPLREASAKIAGGDVAAGQHALEDVEAALVQHGAGPDATAALRDLRADVAAVLRDWRLAARHHAQSARRFPEPRRYERWQRAMRQADALVLQAEEFGDTNALFEAAQVHAESGSLINEREAPLEWALSHVELGRLLLRLGEHEGRPERYLAAALHFKPAVSVFSTLRAEEDWACAQLGLAHALKGQGEFQGDVVVLADAVFSFRAALGVVTRERAPREWLDAQVALGDTLSRMGEETGDTARFQEALEALRQANAFVATTGLEDLLAELMATEGRAWLGLAAGEQDEQMLENAATLLSKALAVTHAALAPAKSAACQRALGTALWALGETRADVDALRAAAAATFAALGYYETQADELTAGELREDLENLHDVMERLGFAAEDVPGAESHTAARAAG